MAFSAASQAEDNILITNALNGDSEAFGQLVKKHHALLFNLSFRMLGNREEAEDVIQQVFIEAYRHLKDFHREAQFSTWLYSITLNRTRNCLRSRKNRSLVSIDPNWTDDEQRSEIQLADHSPSPEKLLEKKSDLEWLHKNVKLLSVDYQAIVTLHYFQNLSLQEVSVRLKRPVATVKVYLHRARKELLKLWSQEKTRGESLSLFEMPMTALAAVRPAPFVERRSLEAYLRWARGCSLIAALFGGLGLFGWFHDNPLLAQLNKNSVLIAPRAALAFLVLGMALYLYLQKDTGVVGKSAIVLAGGFVFWLGLANNHEFPRIYTFIEPVLLKNMNIWEFIYRDRMEPLIAYTFFILGPAAIVSPFLRNTTGAVRDLMGGVSLVVVVVHGMLILGFLYGTPLSYPVGNKPPSFPSAAASLAMGLAFLGASGPRNFPILLFAGSSIRARLLRTFLPVGIISVIIYGLLTHTMFGPLNPALSSLLGIFLSTSIIAFLVLRTAHVVGRQIEHSVRESEERFTILVESIKDYAMIMLDPEGYIMTWNSGAARFTGYHSQDIIGEHFSCFYLPEDLAAKKPMEDLAEAKARGSIEKNGWRLLKNGTRFWADVILTAVYDDNGYLRGFSEVTRDVTERRRIDEESRERNALIQLLQKISSAANEAFKLEESFHITLELICQQMGWALGHALTFSPDGKSLVSGIWHAESNEDGFNAFRAETDRLFWHVGEGLPGRVLAEGKPAGSADLNKDLRSQSALLAGRAGLRSVHLFPILLGTEVVAVLEFFSTQAVFPGSAFSIFMTQVGYQLGQVVERQRVEEKMSTSLRDKEVLLKEIHHRVKNNLQIITSLLRLQSETIQDARVLDMFRESQSRVRSMALVHEYLYKSPDLASIRFPEYVQNIVSSLFRSYGVQPEIVTLHLDIEEIPLDLNTAIPTGLIMTELVANVLKHAFPNGQHGELWVSFHAQRPDAYDLIVKDNGQGLTPDIQLESAESLGLRLVRTLVGQLRGTITINRENGAEFKITLKKQT